MASHLLYAHYEAQCKEAIVSDMSEKEGLFAQLEAEFEEDEKIILHFN